MTPQQATEIQWKGGTGLRQNTVSSFSTVQSHTAKLDKESLNIKNSKRENERLQRQNTQKNRGIPYSEVTTALHKVYVALANPHPVTAN